MHHRLTHSLWSAPFQSSGGIPPCLASSSLCAIFSSPPARHVFIYTGTQTTHSVYPSPPHNSPAVAAAAAADAAISRFLCFTCLLWLSFSPSHCVQEGSRAALQVHSPESALVVRGVCVTDCVPACLPACRVIHGCETRWDSECGENVLTGFTYEFKADRHPICICLLFVQVSWVRVQGLIRIEVELV